MLLMAVSGAAVLALVCWAALRETAQANEAFIPQHGPDGQAGDVADAHAPADGGQGLLASHDSLNGSGAPRAGVLADATVADAETSEALAAAAALWQVLVQRDSSRG